MDIGDVVSDALKYPLSDWTKTVKTVSFDATKT